MAGGDPLGVHPSPSAARITRRGWLALSGAAACVVAGGALSGCATAAKVAATPAVTKPKTTLVVTPWGQDGALATTTSLLYEAMAPFRDKHPGVDTKVQPALAGSNFVPSIIAGDAPDVIHDWTISQYRDQDYLLPLDDYIRRDNLSLDVFVSPMLRKLRNVKGQTIGLPAILATPAVAVDLGTLDDMGVVYPDPDWGYKDFTTLAERLVVRGQKKRLGTTLFPAFATGPGRPAGFYFHGFGAGYVDATNPAACGLTGQGAVDCAEWMAHLLGDGIASVSTVEGSLGSKAAMGMVPSWSLVTQALSFRSLKWRYWNMPTWPAQPATFSTSNYWAIPSSCKQPDLAWELLSWLATSKDWVRSNIKLFLMSPALKSMWSEWESTVGQIAPPLANKNLGAFSQLALTDHAYPAETFAYADAQAYTAIINGPYGLLSAVVTKKATAQQALPQIVHQVNAIEAAGALESAQKGQVVQALQSAGATTTFAAPARTGIGTAAKDGTHSVTFDAKTGTYTILGTGADVWNGDDNGVLAAMPWTSGGGEFICRLTTMVPAKGPLHGYAKAGLMARGDLSNDAALVAIEATGQNGIFSQNLFEAGGSPASWGAGGRSVTASKGGFIAGVKLTLPANKPVPNYLIKPVWLRMTRQGLQWTVWSSDDGKKWTQAGDPIPALMEGCWVGIFVSPQSPDATIKATFDNLSFKPTTFVRLGSA